MSGSRETLHLARYSRLNTLMELSSSPWLDLRVFYVRISSFEIDSSTPEFLKLNHIPLTPDTLFEVNGVRSSSLSEGVSSSLRRDRADKKCEEATFISTESIRMCGSVKFEVFDREDLILSGVLEMSDSKGSSSKGSTGKWSMKCESKFCGGSGFLKGRLMVGAEFSSPAIEVYVAGRCSGDPVILTRTLLLRSRKKQSWKSMLDVIPESETPEDNEDQMPEHDFQVAEHMRYKQGDGYDVDDYDSPTYWKRRGYFDGEEGEISWFNAGVRVGLGIGLGVCLGLGVGVGLLVRTYRATTRNIKQRFI